MNRRTPESAGLSSQRLTRLEGAFARRIEKGELAGVATVVAREGRLVHFHVQGRADIEKGTPLAEDTLYHIYSMSKPITAVAILMLMEEGRFQFDDPAAAVIPELGSVKVLSHQTEKEPSWPIFVDP